MNKSKSIVILLNFDTNFILYLAYAIFPPQRIIILTRRNILFNLVNSITTHAKYCFILCTKIPKPLFCSRNPFLKKKIKSQEKCLNYKSVYKDNWKIGHKLK